MILIHGSNKSENQKEKTNSTLNSQPHPRHSTPKGKLHASHPTPSLQSPPATRGGMAHEEQNDPVAQSSMYQRRPPNLTTSTADLSERDNKENPVVKEEETNDTAQAYLTQRLNFGSESTRAEPDPHPTHTRSVPRVCRGQARAPSEHNHAPCLLPVASISQ